MSMDLSWQAVCQEHHIHFDPKHDHPSDETLMKDRVLCNGREFTYHIDCDHCQAIEVPHTGAGKGTTLSVTPTSEGPFQVRVQLLSGTDHFEWAGAVKTAVRPELELWCSSDGEPLAPCGDRELDREDTYLAVAAPSVDGPHFLIGTDLVSFHGVDTETWGPIPGDPHGRTGVKLYKTLNPGPRTIGLEWRTVHAAKTVRISA